jgi:hypothetical protein
MAARWYSEAMLKLALAALLTLLVVLGGLALLPERERAVPDEHIVLFDVHLSLYPQADRAAVWTFTADTVSYRPSSRETTLHRISDGQRLVGGVVDFILRSDEVVIDAQDNLRGERILVHLVEANWDLDMQARGGRPVVIDQRAGTFSVPVLTYTGDGLGANRAENVRMNFDLTDFQASCEGASCYNQFEDTSLQRSP